MNRDYMEMIQFYAIRITVGKIWRISPCIVLYVSELGQGLSRNKERK